MESLEMDIQFRSDDGTVKPGDIVDEWSRIFIGAGEKMGRTFKIAERSKKLIEEAGFVDVVEKKYKLPVGTWPKDEKLKEIGRWNLLFLTEGLEGMSLFILKNILQARLHFSPSVHVSCLGAPMLLWEIGCTAARTHANTLIVGIY